jgi:hypothetical protein
MNMSAGMKVPGLDYSLASNDQGTSPPDRRQWASTLKRPANLSSEADNWEKFERRAKHPKRH